MGWKSYKQIREEDTKRKEDTKIEERNKQMELRRKEIEESREPSMDELGIFTFEKYMR